MKFWATQPRRPMVGLAVAAMLGIVVADRFEVPAPWAFGAALLAMCVVVFRPATFTCWIFCAALFFELHTLRHWNSDARWLAGVLANGPRVVQITGTVWSEPVAPTVWSFDTKWRFVVKLGLLKFDQDESPESDRKPTPMDSLVNVSWAGAKPAYGDHVRFTGGATNLTPARNPGEFDFLSYERRRGIYSEIRTRYPMNCEILEHGPGNPIVAFGLAAQQWVKKRLETGLADSPDVTEVIDGIVLGLRSESPEELKVLLQRTGTIHLFVVSGLNIAMLTAIAFGLLSAFGLPRKLIFILTIILLWAYVFTTGMRTASVRSTIMATVLLGAAICDRRAISLNSLAAAAFVILILDSNELFAPGFQFSFTVVFVIIVCASSLRKKLESFGQPDPFLPRVLWSWRLRSGVWCWRWLCGVLSLMVASWVGSLLFTVGYFHLFSPGSLVANSFAALVAFCILAMAVASMLTPSFLPHLILRFNNANWLLGKVMLGILKISAAFPGSWLYVENPKFARPPKCEVYVLDLGEGGAAHVRAGGHDWLLNCGDDGRYNRTVLPYLRTRGINQLDGLLLTHGSAPHIGAAVTVLQDFQPRLLAESVLDDRSTTRKHVREELAAQHRGTGLYWRDDFIRFGKTASMRVLYPPAGLKRSVAADKALVLQLQSAGTRVLFMSDSGFTTETWLLENEPDLKSDIVIKGQHAKDFSGTQEFLARVAPRVVVCGTPGYRQSMPESLDAWEQNTAANGIVVFRQDKTGAVQIEIRDDAFSVRGFLNGQTFLSRAR